MSKEPENTNETQGNTGRSSKNRWMGMGILGLSLLLHAALLLVIGSVVVIESRIKSKPTGSYVIPEDSVLALDEVVPDMLEATQELAEPTIDEVLQPGGGGTEQSLAPDLIAAESSTSFNLPISTVPFEKLRAFGNGSGGGEGGGIGTGKGTGQGSGIGKGKGGWFGSIDPGSGLLGILWDLKVPSAEADPETFQRVSNDTGYVNAVKQFYKQDQDPASMSQYFRAPEKLYRTLFFQPAMGSTEAPKSFGYNGKGGYWLAYYKGDYMAPKGGKYRFWAAADNYVAVKVNGKFVVTSSVNDGFDNIAYQDGFRPDGDSAPKGIQKHGAFGPGHLRPGRWVNFQEGKSYTIEICMADDGGIFAMGVMVEKKGDDQGAFFQTAPLTDEQKKGIGQSMDLAVFDHLIFTPVKN
jgi:hypothetical protein